MPNFLHTGDMVIIDSDDWSLIGKRGIVVDPHPFNGSTTCIVRVGEVLVTLARHEVEVLRW
jgi:hypothetical protein